MEQRVGQIQFKNYFDFSGLIIILHSYYPYPFTRTTLNPAPERPKNCLDSTKDFDFAG